MSEQRELRARTPGQSEFERLVKGHISDIRALAAFYARQGCDAGMLARSLMDAAEDLREAAHLLPSRRDSGRVQNADNIVHLVSAEADRRGSLTSSAPL